MGSGFRVENVQGSRFRVRCVGSKAMGSGFSVQGAASTVTVSGFRVQSALCRIQARGFRVPRSGWCVHGSGFGAQGSGFTVHCVGSKVMGSGFSVQGAASTAQKRKTQLVFLAGLIFSYFGGRIEFLVPGPQIPPLELQRGGGRLTRRASHNVPRTGVGGRTPISRGH